MNTEQNDVQAIEQRAAAIDAAANTLRRCAPLIAARATGAPLFERKLKPEGSRPLLCRVVWPGIVQVIDLEDGKLLASSTPGNPRELAPDFVPGRTLK